MDELTRPTSMAVLDGLPDHSSPAIVGDTAYVASIEPALHCTRREDRRRTVGRRPASATSPRRGRNGSTPPTGLATCWSLDAKTGAPVGRMPVGRGDVRRSSTIRPTGIFLVNDRGSGAVPARDWGRGADVPSAADRQSRRDRRARSRQPRRRPTRAKSRRRKKPRRGGGRAEPVRRGERGRG